MLSIAEQSPQWRLINFRAVDCLLAAEALHELYNRHKPSINSVRFRNTIISYRDRQVRAFAPATEWKRLERWLGARFLRGDAEVYDGIADYCRRSFPQTDKCLAAVGQALQGSNSELALYLIDVHYKPLGELYEINLVQLEHALTAAVRKQLAAHIAHPVQRDTALAELSRTSTRSACLQEHQAFEEIVACGRNGVAGTTIAELLERHHRLWGHLRNGYGKQQDSLEDLRRRYARSLREEDGTAKVGAGETSWTQVMAKDAPLMRNIELLREIGIVRDRQKAEMGRVGDARAAILEEVARRTGESCEHLSLYLLNEICELLDGGSPVDARRIARRREGVTLRRMEVLLEEPMSLEDSADLQSGGRQRWLGRCASPGKRSGRAVLVRDLADAARVERGDIMIAQGTDFDMLDAMMLSGGIVTEEGGLLSHAAIVARELGIPCLVGVDRITRDAPWGAEVLLDADAGYLELAEKV